MAGQSGISGPWQPWGVQNGKRVMMQHSAMTFFYRIKELSHLAIDWESASEQVIVHWENIKLHKPLNIQLFAISDCIW
jgi:hypothetical protein